MGDAVTIVTLMDESSSGALVSASACCDNLKGDDWKLSQAMARIHTGFRPRRRFNTVTIT